MLRRTSAVFISVGAAAVSFGLAPARADAPPTPTANPVIVAGPAAEQLNYLTQEVVLPQGDSLTFVQADPISFHNVVVKDASGQVVASSGYTVGFQSTPTVAGAESLPPGTYKFYCTPHPNMVGTLVVVAPPTAG